MPRYYDLTDDRRSQDRWHLRAPVDEQGRAVDPWQFRKGLWLEAPGRIRFPVKPDGGVLDFTLASFAIPIVSGRLKQLLEHLGIQEVQFLPVQVEEHPEPWFILNALRVIRCIDEARCEEVQTWLPEDGQPEKVGEYRVVSGLRIDPAKVGEAQIFRPWGWRVALVVSGDVKEAWEAAALTGMRFVEV